MSNHLKKVRHQLGELRQGHAAVVVHVVAVFLSWYFFIFFILFQTIDINIISRDRNADIAMLWRKKLNYTLKAQRIRSSLFFANTSLIDISLLFVCGDHEVVTLRYDWNALHVCTKSFWFFIRVNSFFILNLQAKMRLLKSMAPFLSTSRSTKSPSSREDLGKPVGNSRANWLRVKVAFDSARTFEKNTFGTKSPTGIHVERSHRVCWEPRQSIP